MECKETKLYNFSQGGRDLIDTLWNVKDRRGRSCRNRSGFNRYIVECKAALADSSGSAAAKI